MLLAETATRVGAQLGGRAGLLSAALLVRDPGNGDEPEPSGVGVAATRRAGGHYVISWIGDAHALSWDGERLIRRTTPHTLAEQLRVHGFVVDPATADWITTALPQATPATVLSVECDDSLVLLCSDGIDCIPANELEGIVRDFAHEPQALADSIVAAASEDAEGYRDDVTVVVIRAPEEG